VCDAPASRHAALAAVSPRLRCPQCGAPLGVSGGQLSCEARHAYDIGRHGHVTLLPPRRHLPLADSPSMVAARQAFLAGGHYAPIARELAVAARDAVGASPAPGGCAVDLGAGTGYYLTAVLEQLGGWSGLALDASRPALRHAARAHPGIATIACDVWHPLPLRDGAADLVINVFAPRNAPEIARVLAPAAALLVVTPGESHLRQLAGIPGMLGVERDKQAHLHAKLIPHLRIVDRRALEFGMRLGADDVRALVAMGPSAHHVAPGDVAGNAGIGAGFTDVTASVVVETFRAA